MTAADQESMFDFADALGPEKIIHLHDPSCGLRAVLVVDNVAAGPAIGGVRMAIDASTSECVRLARAMTLKNAMAGLAHGGAKSVIMADPGLPAQQKTRLTRAFAHAIRQIHDYIPGPDMGTNEQSMAEVRSVIGRAVGLPREVGGIPLDEIGATGWGLCAALEVLQQRGTLTLDGARIVVQGFGSVGQHAARFLTARGALLVGVADSRGARICTAGFDLDALLAHKQTGAGVAEFSQGEPADERALIKMPSDVWIPAARPDVIRADNADDFNTRVIAQGANIPASPEAEAMLAARGVLVLPDFVVNAGGVICAAVEYHQGSEGQAMAEIAAKISANVTEMLNRAEASATLPREAALTIATERVQRAMSFRQTW